MITMLRQLTVTTTQDGLVYSHPAKGVLAIGWAPPTNTEPATWGACYYACPEYLETGLAERRWAAASRYEHDRLVETFLNTDQYFTFDRFADFVDHELPLLPVPRDDDGDDFEPEFDEDGRPYKPWNPYRDDELL